jgi:beta-galactosidase
MAFHWRIVFAFGLAAAGNLAACPGGDEVELPDNVSLVWDIETADREATAMRERICINGLWRWQPDERDGMTPPEGSWGFFKVPGCWPGITDYMQKDCQTVRVNSAWRDVRLAAVRAAWYQREITLPAAWAGRRVTLAVECLNSQASVYLDGKPVGELRFPGGVLDITASCRPGGSSRPICETGAAEIGVFG